MRIFFLIFLVQTIATGELFAQDKKLPAELNAFVPAGSAMLDFVKADLNVDGRSDYVLILKTAEEDTITFDNPNWDAGRPLLLITRQPDNKLKLTVTNEDIVLCRHCGGAMGDPYMGITAKTNEFTVDFYGGSSWKWGQTTTFRYDRIKKNWYLQKDVIFSSHPTEDGYEETKATISREEAGEVTLKDYTTSFNSDSSRRRVIVAKTWFYQSPELKSAPRKAYLIKGDVVKSYRQFKNFIECVYENKQGASTIGYILRKDLEIVK